MISLSSLTLPERVSIHCMEVCISIEVQTDPRKRGVLFIFKTVLGLKTLNWNPALLDL